VRRSKIHQLRVAHIVSWADHTLLPASQAHSCITRKDLNEVIVRLPRLQSKLWILAQQHNRQDQTGWCPPSQELQHYHRVRLWNSGEEIVSWCFVQIKGRLKLLYPYWFHLCSLELQHQKSSSWTLMLPQRCVYMTRCMFTGHVHSHNHTTAISQMDYFPHMASISRSSPKSSSHIARIMLCGISHKRFRSHQIKFSVHPSTVFTYIPHVQKTQLP